jgi:endoglucanase
VRFDGWPGALAALTVLGGGVLAGPALGRPGVGRAAVRSALRAQCADPYPAARDPGNPLMLSPRPRGGDPLAGARFFLDGPRHGAAAGAIARLLGIDQQTPPGQPLPSFADSVSWASFARTVARRLPQLRPGTAYRVRMLEKIASEPEPQRVSAYSAGGSPAGIFAQTQKLFCHNFTADPGAIPVISTYFLHAVLHGCPTPGRVRAYAPTFEAQIAALAAATGRRPVVFLTELDAIGSSSCIARDGALPEWESLLRYEASTLGALPHAVVYLEGGYSDAGSAAYAARILNHSGISGVAGFYTNGTHLNWTSHEVSYAERVSRLTHRAHFIVNTAQNGRGPKLNPHPVTQGVEDLCNPPGRGLGPRPTTAPGFRNADAFLWTAIPGNSSGCGGGPPGGVFWPARAVGLAARANGQLGPGYPSRPY